MKPGLFPIASLFHCTACATIVLFAAAAISVAGEKLPTLQSQMDGASGFSSSLTGGAAGGGSNKPSKDKKKQRSNAGGNSIQPAVEIPVGPLGFAPPARFYLGDRVAQVSLDFLDENRLLFTFRVPGLISRETPEAAREPGKERHVRAVVLTLPDGKVTAESLWSLHDFARYLWMMRDGRFVLRDRDALQMGDDTLRLKPYIRFPGPVNSIAFDPGEKLLMAETTEPMAGSKGQASNSIPDDTVAGLPAPAAASISPHGGSQDQARSSRAGQRDLLRILDAKTGKVRLYSEIHGMVHLPVDGEGYYEALRGDGDRWLIEYQYFSGQSRQLGWIESTCDPPLDVPAPGAVLASACLASGERRLTLFARDGDAGKSRLWDQTISSSKVWPQLRSSLRGLRIARATLDINHPVGIYSPLDQDDIHSQSVQVFDMATGRIAITVPASPVLDGGGNFALSPSGLRLAVLNGGEIQVYDLPEAPAMPGNVPAKGPPGEP